MPKNNSSINNSLFDLLKGKGYSPTMLSTAGKEIPTPDEAEVFQFNFVKDGEDYGKVTLTIDDSSNLIVYYSDDVADSEKETSTESGDLSWYGLLNQLKRFAQRYQLSFELRNTDNLKSDMAKRDYMKKQDQIAESRRCVSEMNNRTLSGDRKEQRANSPEAIAQREKEQQANLKKVSPEMRKKLRLPNPDKEDMAEGSEKTASQMSFDNSSEDWKTGYKDYPNYKLHSSLEKTARGKKYRQGWEEAFRASKRIEALKKQDVAEGQSGVSVKKWAEQVRQEHGADTKFWNDKVHDRVIARKDKEIVGSYDRKANNGTVFSPEQGVAEGLNEFAQGDFNGDNDNNDLQLYLNVAKKLNMKKYKPSTAHDLIAKKMSELVDAVDDEKVDWARHMARKAQGLPSMLDQQGVAEGSEEKDPVWNKGTPMPKDYTCHCGIAVHPSVRNPKAIHTPDCPYAKKQDMAEGTDDSTQVLSDIVANEDFDALYNLMSSDTEAGKIVQRMYNDVSGEEGLHPDDDFEKILSIVLDHLTQDYGQQDVAEGSADKTVRVIKRNGKPIGEIGIDPEASPGNGSYYVKLYDGSVDESGFDTAEEALAELKYLVKQNVSEDLHLDEGITDFILKAKDKFLRLKDALSDEWAQSKQMWQIVKKGNAATSREINFANNQFKDILKMVGLGAWYTLPIPGNTLLILMTEKLLNRNGMSIMPDKIKNQVLNVKEKGIAEGYSLKKTSVSKHMEPGDPEEYTQDVNIKDTDYEIINNKTGQVVGTASQTTNDFMGSGALKITMKNGATRWLDIWDSEKGNPQTAFNRFVKDPKTASKYKGQDMKGVTEMDKSQTPSGRDGHVSHSTYGSRDKGDSTGTERTAKPVTAKQATTNAMAILNKQSKKKDMAEGTGSNSRALRIAEKIWAKYGSPKNEDPIYPDDLIDLVDAAAGGRTYLFSNQIETVPGVKTIMASINFGKFYDRAKFDKGVAILLKAAPKLHFGESAEQGIAEAKGDEYYDLTAEHVPAKAIPLIKKEMAQAGITLKFVKKRDSFSDETVFEIVTGAKGLKAAKNIIWKYNKGNYVGIMNEQDMAEGNQQVNEGYYPMGKQGSYSDAVPTTKIVIQHSRRIEEGEQRYRNIAKIFVENSDGERFAVPTNKPGIARVYARHIAEGGTPYDERGRHITSLVEEYSKMSGFMRATRGKQFNESAQKLVTEAVNYYQSLRESLSKMTGHRGYSAYFESWTPALMEDGEEQETNLNELFVQETLDPRIESVMPILGKLQRKLGNIKQVDELAEWADNIIEGDGGQEALNSQGIPEAAGAETLAHNIRTDRSNLKAFDLEETTDVTDDNPKSQGGTRAELLRKYANTKRPKDAEAARRAGASQSELKAAADSTEEIHEGASSQDLQNAILYRVEMRHPDLVSKYGHEYVADKALDVASFYAGAEEIGSSDISAMVNHLVDTLKREGENGLDENLDANQIRAGQLGPTEKVGPQGAVGKLVGAEESVNESEDELARILQMVKHKR
jgi:hypothetical protein